MLGLLFGIITFCILFFLLTSLISEGNFPVISWLYLIAPAVAFILTFLAYRHLKEVKKSSYKMSWLALAWVFVFLIASIIFFQFSVVMFYFGMIGGVLGLIYFGFCLYSLKDYYLKSESAPKLKKISPFAVFFLLVMLNIIIAILNTTVVVD